MSTGTRHLRLVDLSGGDIPVHECHLVWLVEPKEITCGACKKLAASNRGPWIYWYDDPLCLDCFKRCPTFNSMIELVAERLRQMIREGVLIPPT